jgi:hypothetical protein
VSDHQPHTAVSVPAPKVASHPPARIVSPEQLDDDEILALLESHTSSQRFRLWSGFVATVGALVVSGLGGVPVWLRLGAIAVVIGGAQLSRRWYRRRQLRLLSVSDELAKTLQPRLKAVTEEIYKVPTRQRAALVRRILRAPAGEGVESGETPP